MKEKKWVDCPSCGSKGSMQYRKNITETYRNSGYNPIKVAGLDGYFCRVCNEGIFTIKSNKKIASSIAEGKALQDSDKIVASSITDVDSVAKTLSVSRQRVHQMMDEGKLSYVYVGKNRFPLKSNEKTIKQLKMRIKKQSSG